MKLIKKIINWIKSLRKTDDFHLGINPIMTDIFQPIISEKMRYGDK